MKMQHIAIAIQLLNNPKYVTNQTVTINQFDNGAGVPFKVKNLDGDCIDYVDFIFYVNKTHYKSF